MDFSNLSATDKANYMRTLAQLDAVPPQVRAAIAQEAIASQREVKAAIYYSTIRARAARTGAGPFTYTLPVQTLKAFTFKEGDDMGQAGFAAGTLANLSHTNLTTGGSQTNDGADVVIWGISVEVAAISEPRLVAEFLDASYVEISTSAAGRTRIGKLQDFPGSGGLYGGAHTKLEAGNLAETIGPVESYLSNGNPMAGNFWKLPYPIRWNAVGNKKKDTALSVLVTMTEARAVTAADRAAVAGAAPGASGRVEAFTSPADGARGTFAQFRIKLATVQIGERSVNG